jgi:hypothetical protein
VALRSVSGSENHELAQLSSTAAAGQKVLALNGVNFGLSDAAIKN